MNDAAGNRSDTAQDELEEIPTPLTVAGAADSAVPSGHEAKVCRKCNKGRFNFTVQYPFFPEWITCCAGGEEVAEESTDGDDSGKD